MSTTSKWQRLATEAVNPGSRDIDILTPDKIIEVMILDNRQVLAAVQRERRRIARGAELIATAVLNGGRLIFVGAGTSGRLGVLEAAELPPTFGIDAEAAVAIMAGGAAAVHRAKEGIEDDHGEGARAMRRLRPSRRDVVLGISASGITPFVRGAVARAHAAKAPIIGVTCDPRSELKEFANVTIVLSVGPEVIAGSTRLKAGTATKMALNMLTTAAMVRAGKTYGNLMVDVKSNSEKLRDRGRRIIGAVTGLDYEAADALLRRAKWNVKAAILMQQTGASHTAAVSRLRVEPRLRKLLGRR
ncbi:MAG TPA: N-acetylmuramic acid 6-phosphate etherase [Vicinamibacterales bacterium]|nr:N-acetylmuramic acid 6-phosphate etherase [Vicinamibacterales bacterium]